MPSTVLLALIVPSFGTFDDSKFMSWFDTVLDEVYDHEIVFQGEVPPYVRGHFVQSGPGRLDMGDKKMTHSFDGYSKITRLDFGENRTAFSSSFLRSSFYNFSVQKNTIVPAITMGYTEPRQTPGPWGAILGANDNNYVKCQSIGDTEMALSDSPVAVWLEDNFSNVEKVIRPLMLGGGTPGEKWKDSLYMDGHVCATGIMAHGQIDPYTGKFTGEMTCLSVLEDTQFHQDYHIVFEIDPATPDKRELIAKVALPFGRKASMMHSMVQTENYIVLVGQPLHMSTMAFIQGKPLGEGAVVLGNTTLYQIISRQDGSVRQFEGPGWHLAHVANAWEESGDIIFDASHYENDDRMSFIGMFMLKNLENKTIRDAWQKNKMMRVRLTADSTVEMQNLMPNEPDSMFELLVVNPKFHGRKHCIMWAAQAGSNAYDEDKNSTKVGPAGAYGLAKRNFCTGERSGFYSAAEYPSEPRFIPNPEGTAEDDGVLVGIVYDAHRGTSFVQVLDARTMQRVAKAEMHLHVPFLVHSTWYPEGTPVEQLVV